MASYKSNHYVPRAYLRRFAYGQKLRQIALFNLASGKLVPSASIKDQCAADYFYSKNPVFEQMFGKLESSQQALLDKIIASNAGPLPASPDHVKLCNAIMFQCGRTASAAEYMNHTADQVGKMMLKHRLEAEGKKELLGYLPEVEITVTHGVLDSIAQCISLSALLLDLECVLLKNETDEDFLTSDHPIAQCNSIPGITPEARMTGFASRGLLLLYPLSPRLMMVLHDAETYAAERSQGHGAIPLKRERDVVELNLPQCRQAFQNLYFQTPGRVKRTLRAFQDRASILRPPPPSLSIGAVESGPDRSRIRYDMIPRVPFVPLPKPLRVRHVARTGRYKNGDARVRNYALELEARHEANRVEMLRAAATKRAQAAKSLAT